MPEEEEPEPEDAQVVEDGPPEYDPARMPSGEEGLPDEEPDLGVGP